MTARRMTPLELARFIPEDPNDPIMEDPHAMPSGSGLPAPIDEPGMMSQAGMNASPGFGDEQVGQQQSTAVNSCMASSCAHNCNGMCGLDSVEINDRGGCDQYEAMADDNSTMSDGRYDEQDSDASGGPPGPQQQSQRWDRNRWDPKGGGY